MRILILLGLTLLLSAKAARSAEPPGSVPLVVSTHWLAEHLKDPDLIIFHVGQSSREYRKGHIPGARFLWTQALSKSSPELTLELPSSLQADTALRNLGVPQNARIVLTFAGGNVTPVTRVFFTLDCLGLGGHVSLLDGGFDTWKAEGRPVSVDLPHPPCGDFSSQQEPDFIVDAEWIMAHRNDPSVAIIDARGTQFFEGRSGGMPRAGHIPGASNIPFTSVVDSTNKLKDTLTLRHLFQAAGAAPGKTVVTYCHIGQQASLIYFVARYLGFDARLYDGSWEDWSMRDELPVVNPSDVEKAKR